MCPEGELRGLRREPPSPSEMWLLCSHRDNLRSLRREPPRLPLRRELSDCIKDLSSTTEGEIMRGHCLLRDIDEHRVKKRSFAFTVGYIYCFRTYLLYLSFRHGVLILYRRATFLLRGRRGRSRAAHGFNFAVKVRHRRYHRSRIQPLSLELKS